MTPEVFEANLGFALDRFQKEAISSIHAGRSVLVAAPTGSGKTVVAEYAVAVAHSEGSKAFYTTPLKALSNQKFGDLVASYGATEVGLLTGDTSVNGEAPIVVMTTEVLRNMIYQRSRTLEGLRFVILDEVHYLQNPYRGGVWEEVIVHAPAPTTLVCLSATVSNVEEFGAWLTTVRGATDVVIEERRPVTLENQYMVAERRSGRLRLLPTLVDGRPNPQGASYDAPEPAGRSGIGESRPQGRRGRYGHTEGRHRTPRRVEVIEELSARGLLPAIYFVFSRDGCDRAATTCLEAGVRLTSEEERKTIRRIAEANVDCLSDHDLSVLGYGHWLACLEAGIASHHAGLVPPFKETVEACFAQAAVKVVFATETLSLGINMPARTVVIERLTKFTGERHERLSPGEYTQLTGRAGRRGLDEVGYGIVLWSPAESFATVASLASRRTYELVSSFRPTYNMVANLVRVCDEEEAYQLVNLSFAQFRADSEIVRLEAELRATRADDRRRLRSLQARIDSHANALSAAFGRVASLLGEEGYLAGWSLSARGERLCRIYHESDLLVSEALEAGLLDGLDPLELAAAVSLFTYEERAAGRRQAPTTRLPRLSERLGERVAAIGEIAGRLAGREATLGLRLTRPPDPGFAGPARRWAGGSELADALRPEGLSAGDFVRNAKQLVDLVRQISEVAPQEATRDAARACYLAVWRGVVAASGATSGSGPPPGNGTAVVLGHL